MQIQDGFIVGIFNYCDRRCEGCAFTSRCRLFAMMAKFEAQLDPSMRVVANSPSLPGNSGPGVTNAVMDMLDGLDEAGDEQGPNHELEQATRPSQDVPPEFDALRTRSDAYREHVWTWLRKRGPAGRHEPDTPLDIVTWSSVFLAGKVVGLLAIQELTLACGDDDGVADGSAKVVLLAIERAHAAWLALVDARVLPMSDAATFIADLVWMHETLEQCFPKARAFVRPAFDEPDAVARLFASEGGAT